MSALTHVVIGTNDLERARAFYDPVLATLGHKRARDFDRASLWGTEGVSFMVARPENGLPATWGNGATVSFAAPTRASVHEFHKVALAHGARDEGGPGPRTFTPTSYAAYVRDLDGNKICAFCFEAA